MQPFNISKSTKNLKYNSNLGRYYNKNSDKSSILEIPNNQYSINMFYCSISNDLCTWNKTFCVQLLYYVVKGFLKKSLVCCLKDFSDSTYIDQNLKLMKPLRMNSFGAQFFNFSFHTIISKMACYFGSLKISVHMHRFFCNQNKCVHFLQRLTPTLGHFYYAFVDFAQPRVERLKKVIPVVQQCITRFPLNLTHRTVERIERFITCT